MDTLYDLLGALPHDDAEDLRAAFRKAVKGAHPDLRPGDPDAALKFRQIVRANEILGDAEQRAAYDHLLALARAERRLATVHPVAARIHSLASTVLVLAGGSIVAVGCYLLLMYTSTALVAPANDVTTRVSPDLVTVGQADSSSTAETTFLVKRESKGTRGEVIAPSATLPLADFLPLTSVVSFPAFIVTPDPAPNDAQSYRARGISAYRNGNLNGAIAALDQAIQLDPNLSASYVDRGIVLYRMRQFDRAFADIARAKQIENKGGSKPLSMMASKLRLAQSGIAPSTPKPQRRTNARKSAKGFASAFLRRNAEVPALRGNAEVPAPDFCSTGGCLPPS
jgi:curved DNA-binding protein CbpA